MIWMEPGVYVRMQPLEGPRAPQPQPLDSGFSSATAYRVLGLHTPSETADAYVILSNDRDEIWFICTRHLRVAGVDAGLRDTRVALCHFPAAAPRQPSPWSSPPAQMAARDDHA